MTGKTTVDMAVPMTPRAFAERLRRLAATRPAAEVVAFYDQHGPAIQPLLRGRDRVSVADIMEVADTVVEYEGAAAQTREPDAAERQTQSRRASDPSAATAGVARAG